MPFPDEDEGSPAEAADDTSLAPSFRGLISLQDIHALHLRFSELVICPGLVATFGHKTDQRGRVRLPSALKSTRKSIMKFEEWEARARQPEGQARLAWWAKKLRERDMKPIKASRPSPATMARQC